MKGHEPVTKFEDWYTSYEVDERSGCLEFRGLEDCADAMWRRFQHYKREMDTRVANFYKLEKLADGEVLKEKPDLPNVSSGETAGLVRRIARNLVQNAPNVEILNEFDDDSMYGVFARHILLAKIIGSDLYSNDMQQHLFASTKTALTLGFDAVIPVLSQEADGSWYMKYDAIHYRDVFPEPGAKDVRSATDVFIRRYLTKGEAVGLIRDKAVGWDEAALKTMLKSKPRNREMQSVDHQTRKQGIIPEGYEIITWYSSSGDAFLTFCANTKMLLRIEKNKHPMKKHPVFFLVLEKDAQQPLGKSQVELLVGRQDFQDLMLNGAMKLWYRNINPSVVVYGGGNAAPNLGPGKYTQLSNPNARVEAFEVNTQTLMQYGSISQNNLGSMVSLVGAADQQMASQAGNGMSATPQGVEAQEAMVDITTNNYQKSIESFFSHYCSYALTIYFAELAATKSVVPNADTRLKLLELGMEAERIKKDGSIDIDFSEMQVPYFVRCVPGSLVEMEDEKQLRILNELFIPLSQAMPALASTQDQQMLTQATLTMQYIISKQIELSGATDASDLNQLWTKGGTAAVEEKDARIAAVEGRFSDMQAASQEEAENSALAIGTLQEQMSLMVQNQQVLLERLGVIDSASGSEVNNPAESNSVNSGADDSLAPASA